MKDNRQMKALSKMVFISEIVLQSKIAQLAAKRLSATHDHFDQIEVWFSIQSILVAAGNVSKILWPQKKKYAARGEGLRKLLKVAASNHLSDRKFRNHFEHYDERIENWFEENSSAVYRDLAIDPFKPIWGPNLTNQHRAYNPLTKTLTFRGETFDLAAVMNEFEEIRIKCRQFALP
jgi:hypothetical protein